ncbi:MAG: hypothetical protein ACREE6_04525 [Limisphaerales bacterium]
MNKNQIDLSQRPDPLPKAGDTVSYVQPGNKIVQGKVASVDAKSDGRAITLEGVSARDKKPLRIVYRPKNALAGNTWHWPLALFALLACMAFALAVPARAALPTYHTFSGYGNSTTPATVILPADPNSQIRVVTILYSSDNAGAQFTFSSGSTAYSEIWTNLATSTVTNLIDSTNGLAAGSVLVLQHNGVCYTNAVVSWGNVDANLYSYQLTNVAFVVTGTGGFGVVPSVGDPLYLMTAPQSWFAGATTNALNGDDIFSGNFGRPVIVQLGPATATNRLNSISAHYDSASQF